MDKGSPERDHQRVREARLGNQPVGGETTADRLTMISTAQGYVFAPTVFVQKGETWWVSGGNLLVRGLDGQVRRVSASAVTCGWST